MKRVGGWRPKLKVRCGSPQSDAWCYYSVSGKTAEVYVRPLDSEGNPYFREPIIVRVPCAPPKEKP